MRFLLDTHTLAWAVGQPSMLSPRGRRMLEDRANDVYVSTASIWEMSIKFKAGRWPEVLHFMDDQLYADMLNQLGATELAITSRHARAAGLFELDHKDPFDRIIAAQSFLEGLPVLSKDTSLDAFPVSRIW